MTIALLTDSEPHLDDGLILFRDQLTDFNHKIVKEVGLNNQVDLLIIGPNIIRRIAVIDPNKDNISVDKYVNYSNFLYRNFPISENK